MALSMKGSKFCSQYVTRILDIRNCKSQIKREKYLQSNSRAIKFRQRTLPNKLSCSLPPLSRKNHRQMMRLRLWCQTHL
ncbi:hypothetical protein FGO68_gene8277 [Halteria grandinella]|uniref:Uncharacterized protein n=1 Tax=Halteria grandinella TaxID=5974 RepID=A0A8J8NYH7_HALGN|nr:hypothetical protein FGO68_gene8277 [Halteria grandinella]